MATNSTHARAKKETDHAGWCGHGAPRRASSVSFLLLACLRASILCSAGSALCSSLLHDQRCVVAKLTPVALLFMHAPQVEPSRTRTTSGPGTCLWVTGAPGTGKTTFVKEHVMGAKEGIVNLEDWPVSKEGKRTQLVFHEKWDGCVQIAGVYTFPSDDRFPVRRRGTSPANVDNIR